MKKLSKKNKIGKYQTAWGPLAIPIEGTAELGATTTSNPITIGSLTRPFTRVIPNIADYLAGATFTASAPELSLALPFALVAGSVGTGIYERRHGIYPHQTSPYATTSVYTPELSDATYVTTPTLSEPRYYSPRGFDIHIGKSQARTDAPAATDKPTGTTTATKENSTTTVTPAPKQPEDPKDWKDLSAARKWAKILGLVGKGPGFAARHALDPEAVLLYLLGGTGYGIYKYNENKKEEKDKEKEKKEELEKRRLKMLGR